MIEVVSRHQYLLAWIVYSISGGVFCLVIWRFTALLNHSGWRDLIRSINLAMIYTPWYISDAREYAAPATIVVAMDLLLGNTDNGLAAAIAILTIIAFLLSLLLLKRALRRNHED